MLGNFVRLVSLIALASSASAQVQIVATFYPVEEINVKATGAPLSIYKVYVQSVGGDARDVDPIDVYRAYPGMKLIPLSREKAELELRTKTERGALRIMGRILVAASGTTAVAFGIKTFVGSATPDSNTKNDAKWSMIMAGAAFVSQMAPSLGNTIIGNSPTYSLPADLLTQPFSVKEGESATFSIVARGSLINEPANGSVLQKQTFTFLPPIIPK